MSPKTVVLVALGMTGSFCLIFALMLALYGPAPAPPRQQGPTAAPRRAQPKQAPQSQKLPSDGRPAPAPQTGTGTVARPGPAPNQAEPTAQDQAARRELQAMRNTIKEQIDHLKKDRDRKVSALAAQLAALPAAEAAAQCDELDEETAALALKRLGAAQRRSLLSHLSEDKARRLRKRL